jgi:hypothetical protein
MMKMFPKMIASTARADAVGKSCRSYVNCECPARRCHRKSVARDAILHWQGVQPPLALIIAEYTVATVPLGNEVAVMATVPSQCVPRRSRRGRCMQVLHSPMLPR